MYPPAFFWTISSDSLEALRVSKRRVCADFFVGNEFACSYFWTKTWVLQRMRDKYVIHIYIYIYTIYCFKSYISIDYLQRYISIILIHTWTTCPFHRDVTSWRIHWKPMGFYTMAMSKQRTTKHWWLAISNGQSDRFSLVKSPIFPNGIQERDTFAIVIPWTTSMFVPMCGLLFRKFVGHPPKKCTISGYLDDFNLLFYSALGYPNPGMVMFGILTNKEAV